MIFNLLHSLPSASQFGVYVQPVFCFTICTHTFHLLQGLALCCADLLSWYWLNRVQKSLCSCLLLQDIKGDGIKRWSWFCFLHQDTLLCGCYSVLANCLFTAVHVIIKGHSRYCDPSEICICLCLTINPHGAHPILLAGVRCSIHYLYSALNFSFWGRRGCWCSCPVVTVTETGYNLTDCKSITKAAFMQAQSTG